MWFTVWHALRVCKRMARGGKSRAAARSLRAQTAHAERRQSSDWQLHDCQTKTSDDPSGLIAVAGPTLDNRLFNLPALASALPVKHQTAMWAPRRVRRDLPGLEQHRFQRERHAFMPPLGDQRSFPQITRPPLMVSRTRAKATGSLAGSPSRSTRSASMPGAMRPLCAA